MLILLLTAHPSLIRLSSTHLNRKINALAPDSPNSIQKAPITAGVVPISCCKAWPRLLQNLHHNDLQAQLERQMAKSTRGEIVRW